MFERTVCIMGMGEETKVAYQYKVPEASERKPDPNQLWDGDYLGHSRIVPTVANMIAGQKGPLTIGLNARWGSGKTFFLKRLAEYYMTPDGYAVYFNAWADDFIGDPLVSLVCQLQEPFDDKTGDTLLKSAKHALFPALKHVGFSLTKSLLKNKVGIDLGDLKPEELETRLEGISRDYAQCVATREELKSALTKLGGEVKEKTDKPLLVIVDELDRCRPTYAIELLERIKHLFCIENIVFVLGIDKEQLGKSIAAIYGDINVEGYLHRFVDIEMGLPDAPKDIFIERLIRRLKLEDCLQDGGADVSVGSFVKAFTAIANSQKLTPRMIEQEIRKFSLVAFAKGHLSHSWVILTAIAVVLNIFEDKSLYRKFVTNQWQPAEIVDVLFPDFKLMFSAISQAGAHTILYLYRLRYLESDNKAFIKAFDRMLRDTGAEGGLDFHDWEMLPRFAVGHSCEEIKDFFGSVTNRAAGVPDLKELLADLDVTMNTICDCSGGDE